MRKKKAAYYRVIYTSDCLNPTYIYLASPLGAEPGQPSGRRTISVSPAPAAILSASPSLTSALSPGRRGI